MLFPTVTFALFFLIVLPLSWFLMPKPVGWRVFILGASYFFYGYWNWRFVFLLVGSTLANQVFARAIHANESERVRRALLTGAVVLNLGLLAYFKYYDFFVSSRAGHARPVRRRRVVGAAHHHAAGRHLVLHLPGAQLRDRRVPPAVRARAIARLRGVPVVLPAPGRGPDRARRGVPAAARRNGTTRVASTPAARSS